MAKMVIDIFKLGARGSWRIPAEVFLRSSTGTQVSDAVKFNMADRVQFLNLAASKMDSYHERRYWENWVG